MFVPLLIALVASSTGLEPKFKFPFQIETVEYGRFLYLVCNAEGEKPITYKWYNKDGDEITGDLEKPIYVSKYELSSILTFKKTSTEHEGSYTCNASNAHGLASKVFHLRVLPPSGLKPEFDSPTENATLESGTVQLLRCEADGEKPITYKWYNQDGDEITEDDENIVFVSKGEFISFLVFNGTSTEHEGSYTCTASNANGQANKVFFIRVPPPSGLKPKFNSPYQNQTLEYGRWQILICEAEGEKPITYKWYNQDGDEITGDREEPIYVSKYELSSILNFNKTSTEHEASYICTASNAHGLASKVFFIRVLPPSGLKPEFDSPTENATLDSGTVQLLRCQAEGEKPITYKWYNQDGDEITEDEENIVFVSKGELISFLVFNGTSTEHEGPYTCTASNANGQANKVFFIRVPPPSDGNGTSRFLDANVLKYTSRSVTFYITTTGPVKYIEAKYRECTRGFNATTIRFDPVPGNIYEIGNLLPSGFYIFQFRTVPSESGDWSREYNINLLSGAPEIILQNIGDRNVKLQWFTSMDGNLNGTIDKHQIKYFSVEMVDGSSWTSTNCSVTTEVPTCLGSSYTIWGLERTIFYQIEVRAHTEAGYSEPWRQKVFLP